ncbi:MAG: hypothetical protein PHI31_09990 [Desulfuromonadaceae bacterium]|nr:hypothetical protein [Desulfuromonadaceae bacterium]
MIHHTDELQAVLSEHCEHVRMELEKNLGTPIPAGVYAGGAISSIVLGKLWGCTIPAVDRFELYRDYPDRIEDDAQYGVFYFTRPFTGEHDLHQNGYTIISSKTINNLVTRVCYRIEMVLGSAERSLFILRGLGLNALQVAAFSDGKGNLQLYATEEFREFAITKQLRVTSPVLGRTYFELGKYRDLFDAYVDWDEEALLMAGFRQAASIYSNACDDVLDADAYRLFEQHYNFVNPYCTVSGASQLVLPGMESLLGSIWDASFDHARATEIEFYVRQALKGSGYSLTSHTFTLGFNILVRKCAGISTRKRFERSLAHTFAVKHALNHPECLQHDFNSKHLEEINAFRNLHPRAMNVIMETTTAFADQVRSIKLLKRLGRLHGNPGFVIGLVEQAGQYGIKLNEISEHSINELVSGSSSIGTDKLLEAADLSKFKYRDVVSECTTREALIWEGRRSSNCIGGYAGTVQRAEGKVRIFHLHTSDDNQHGTAAIYYERQDGDHDVEYELRGPKNSEPTERHIMITNTLACYLRDTLWKPENREDQTIDFNTTE